MPLCREMPLLKIPYAFKKQTKKPKLLNVILSYDAISTFFFFFSVGPGG
jgi:hypothetical protein